MSGIIDGNDYTYTATADLFCTNLDPSGLYTIDFDNVTEKDTYFNGLSSKITLGSNFTYIRKDGVLKVNLNADYLDSMGINYCRFKNSNLDQSARYIYCFIDSVEYLAPTVSALHIRVDSFMTYQDKITTGASHQEFISRRTVNLEEDIIYSNLLDEPVNCTNYIESRAMTYQETISSASDFVTKYNIGVIFTTCIIADHSEFLETLLPTNLKDPNEVVKNALNLHCGHYMNGLPCGGNILVVKDLAHFSQVCEMISALGSDIIATFWIPKNGAVTLSSEYHQVITIENGYTSDTFDCYYYVPDDTSWQLKNLTMTGSISKNFYGYTPINNKCFNYPYNYLYGTDNNGAETIYKFEHFYADASTENYRFNCYFVTNTVNAIVMCPVNYETYTADEMNMKNCICCEGFPQIPYSKDNYVYYLAQNSAAIASQKFSRDTEYIKTFGENLIPASAQMLSDTITRQDYGNVFATAASSLLKSQTGHQMNKLQQEFDRNAEGDVQKQKGININNALSISTRASIGQLGVSVFHKYLTTDNIKLVDDYFSRYGYNWSRIENFSFNHCPDYDFIKTSGCNIEGAIPVADKENLNKLFDSGITIWHHRNGTDRYGLYADGEKKNK